MAVTLVNCRMRQDINTIPNKFQAATLEALYYKMTGQPVEYSKQYFIDCTFSYSGCAGGTVNEGYKLTKDRQYLMYERDWPTTADCKKLFKTVSFFKPFKFNN